MIKRQRKPLMYDEEFYHDFDKLPNLFEIKLGTNLLPLIDEKNGAPLFKEITFCRNRVYAESGLTLPNIKISNNQFQEPDEYTIYLNDAKIAKFSIKTGHCFCIDTGLVTTPLDPEQYEKTKEPAYGLDVFIIPEEEFETAEKAGYEVITIEQAIEAHLHELIMENRTRILDQTMINNLIDKVRQNNPDVITDIFFNNDFKTTDMKIILNTLLEEYISIKDMNTILEIIADSIEETKNPYDLVEKIRQRRAYPSFLGLADEDNRIHICKLSETITEMIANNIVTTSRIEKPYLICPPEVIESIYNKHELFCNVNYQTIFLCTSKIRLAFANFIHHYMHMSDLFVMSEEELYALNNVVEITVEGEVTIDEKTE